MVLGALQIAGLLAACAGGICSITATFLPDWRKNDPSNEILETVIRHQGIWIRCVSYPTGLWQCDDYDAFFIGLPTSLQVSRAMSICANVFGFIGFLLAMFGFQCTTFLEGNQMLKGRVAMVSGGFWTASGICIGVAASVFSNDILQEYMRFTGLPNSDFGAQTYVFGSALFIGWTGMILSIIGGLMVICGSCGDSHPVSKYQRAGVRRVTSIGRSVSMSFRRGRPQKNPDSEYV